MDCPVLKWNIYKLQSLIMEILLSQLRVILRIHVLAKTLKSLADLWGPVLLNNCDVDKFFILSNYANYPSWGDTRVLKQLCTGCKRGGKILKVGTKRENKQLLECNHVLVHSVQIIFRLCMIWHYCSLVVLKGFDFLFKSFSLSQMECGLLFCLILMLFIVVISWFAG